MEQRHDDRPDDHQHEQRRYEHGAPTRELIPRVTHRGRVFWLGMTSMASPPPAIVAGRLSFPPGRLCGLD
jgi:hypothetical protein